MLHSMRQPPSYPCKPLRGGTGHVVRQGSVPPVKQTQVQGGHNRRTATEKPVGYTLSPRHWPHSASGKATHPQDVFAQSTMQLAQHGAPKPITYGTLSHTGPHMWLVPGRDLLSSSLMFTLPPGPASADVFLLNLNWSMTCVMACRCSDALMLACMAVHKGKRLMHVFAQEMRSPSQQTPKGADTPLRCPHCQHPRHATTQAAALPLPTHILALLLKVHALAHERARLVVLAHDLLKQLLPVVQVGLLDAAGREPWAGR